jgi:monothiol glutaredoxin|tara:strand:- start:173 stop:502 length:330 start_codon:yes stop_codon:yes gene_type:complete
MDESIKDKISDEISSSNIHLFMKGTPLFPQCGFSSTVVQILTYLEVPFTTTNVLEDEKIREGIKEFSNWPTIPQLYVKGELMGGCDILKEMFETGELQKVFKEEGLTQN